MISSLLRGNRSYESAFSPPFVMNPFTSLTLLFLPLIIIANVRMIILKNGSLIKPGGHGNVHSIALASLLILYQLLSVFTGTIFNSLILETQGTETVEGQKWDKIYKIHVSGLLSTLVNTFSLLALFKTSFYLPEK